MEKPLIILYLGIIFVNLVTSQIANLTFIGHFNAETYNGSELVDHWLEVPLDHFNLFDRRTWQMRYLVNDKFFEEKGPLFIEVGGEWTISGDDIIKGILPDLAKKHKGMLVETEHRYYGQSLVFSPEGVEDENMTEYFKYLQTEQALEDLAFFIQRFKASDPRMKDSKVVLHGCSYAGMLATWFRLRFPHVADIAYTSSAPLGVGLEYPEYYEVINDIYADVSSDCIHTIKVGFNMTKELLETDNGKETVKKVFESWGCGDMDLMDTDTILWTLLNILGTQNDPYEFENVACLVMAMDQDDIGPLERFAKFIEFKVDKHGGCEPPDPPETSVEEQHKTDDSEETGEKGSGEKQDKSEEKEEKDDDNPNVIPAGILNNVAWLYQMCTEQGTFQTLNKTNPKHPFGLERTFDEAVKSCSDVFELVTKDVLKAGIERTIRRYGGVKPKVTKVLSIQGKNDPWKRLAYLEDFNPEAPVWVTNGAHCVDFYVSEKDEELVQLREKIKDQISTWIDEIS